MQELGIIYPCLLIAYKQLKQAPSQQVEKHGSFLGLSQDPDWINQAFSKSTQAKMKELEEQAIKQQTPSIFFQPDYEKALGVGYRFINQGGVIPSLNKSQLPADILPALFPETLLLSISKTKKGTSPFQEKFRKGSQFNT